MSQKPAAVKSSPPWWLWAMLILATLVIGVGVIFSSIPEDPQAIYDEAYRALQQQTATEGDFAEALQTLRKYPEFSSHVLFLEGALAAAQSRDPKALELFGQAAENSDLKPVVLQSIGRSKTRMGDFKGGIEAYEQSIELSPELANETRVMLSRLYYLVGAKKLAENVLTEVVSTEPKNSEARLQLASICADFNRHTEAVEHQRFLLASAGDFNAASPDVVKSYAENLMAADDQEKLAELSDTYLDFVSDPGMKALVLIAVGKSEEVMGGVEDAILNEMASIEMMLAFINIKIDSGGDDRASGKLEELIESFPRNVDVWKTAAKMFELNKEAGKLAAAEANIQELNELNDRYIAAALNVADNCDNVEQRVEVMNLLLERGEFGDAQGWYEVIKMLDPEKQMPAFIELQMKAMAGPLVPLPGTDDDAKDEAASSPSDAKEDGTKEGEKKSSESTDEEQPE